MRLREIEEAIKPLSDHEKIQLIHDIAEMLKPDAGDVLRRFEQTADRAAGADHGPLEAYTAARQLQAFLQQERV